MAAILAWLKTDVSVVAVLILRLISEHVDPCVCAHRMCTISWITWAPSVRPRPLLSRGMQTSAWLRQRGMLGYGWVRRLSQERSRFCCARHLHKLFRLYHLPGSRVQEGDDGRQIPGWHQDGRLQTRAGAAESFFQPGSQHKGERVKTTWVTSGVCTSETWRSVCWSVQKAQAQLAYELQAAKEQQKIRLEEIEIQVVQRKKEITIEEKEIARTDKELIATVKRPAEAEAYKMQQLAEGHKWVRSCRLKGHSDTFSNCFYQNRNWGASYLREPA